MEYTEGTLSTPATNREIIYPQEFEQAGNSYMMTIVGIIAGLPLPIINVLASVGYYMAYRKSSYFVRWHSIQAILAQLVMLPFNSVLFWWTVSIISNANLDLNGIERRTYYEHRSTFSDIFSGATMYYWLYLAIILFMNLIEFFGVIYTGSRVKKGENVRWFLIANITDALCRKESRDPYKI